ncbi:hypothetical protein CBL_07180 [Carabus blaptoides fortunei]
MNPAYVKVEIGNPEGSIPAPEFNSRVQPRVQGTGFNPGYRVQPRVQGSTPGTGFNPGSRVQPRVPGPVFNPEGVTQMVDRSLFMREVPGWMPGVPMGRGARKTSRKENRYGAMLNKTTRRTELRAESDTVKMLFWNVVGMKVKDKEFWESIKGLDVNGLTQTWIEKKQWNQIKEKLPNEYTYKSKHTKRIHKNGRAMGGILTGIKKNIEEIEIEETVTEEL